MALWRGTTIRAGKRRTGRGHGEHGPADRALGAFGHGTSPKVAVAGPWARVIQAPSEVVVRASGQEKNEAATGNSAEDRFRAAAQDEVSDPDTPSQ